MLRALGSASCDITHETRETICYGHWVVCLVISNDTRGTILLRALTSASCDITEETGGKICYGRWFCIFDIAHETAGAIRYGHCVLRLAISHTRQGVRFVTSIGFRVL